MDIKNNFLIVFENDIEKFYSVNLIHECFNDFFDLIIYEHHFFPVMFIFYLPLSKQLNTVRYFYSAHPCPW